MEMVDVDKAVQFVVQCMNFDGGFGCVPGSESHAGQVINNIIKIYYPPPPEGRPIWTDFVRPLD